MAEIIFYTNPMSRGRIARWMLEEVGVPYRVEIVSLGPAKSPDLCAVNPLGKVPAIRHGDAVVTEAAAICAYLADAFPDAGLAPPTTERAAYYRWMFFAAGPWEASLTNRSLGVVVPEDRCVSVGYGSHETMLATLEGAVSSADYVAGKHFSAADVYVGSHIAWAMQTGAVEKRPAFGAYLARLAERPAYRRAAELDNSLIAQMKADA